MNHEFWQLKQENGYGEKHLKEKDYKTLCSLMDALSIARIGEVQREFIRKDLIGMADEAEHHGETLAETLGEEPNQWCASVIAAGMRAPWWEGLLNVLYEMVQFSLFISVWEWVETAAYQRNIFVCDFVAWTILGALCSCFINYIYPHFATKPGTKGVAYFGIAFISFFVFDHWLTKLGGPILPVEQWAVVAITATLLCLLWLMRRVHQTREYHRQKIEEPNYARSKS